MSEEEDDAMIAQPQAAEPGENCYASIKSTIATGLVAAGVTSMVAVLIRVIDDETIDNRNALFALISVFLVCGLVVTAVNVVQQISTIKTVPQRKRLHFFSQIGCFFGSIQAILGIIIDIMVGRRTVVILEDSSSTGTNFTSSN